jgi:hypothetical protein
MMVQMFLVAFGLAQAPAPSALLRTASTPNPEVTREAGPVDNVAEGGRRRELRAKLETSIAWNQFSMTTDADAPVQAVQVHRWTNDERDPQGEAIAVLWTSRGRPIAVASIYPWAGRLIHELEALSRETFTCRRDGEIVWAPQDAIAYRPVPGAEPPAESPVARMRQMKRIADRFTVTMLGWKGDDSDREQLRRLVKELYRYKPESPETVDGAVFAFVKGTDPEVLLALEAVPGEGGPTWQYAFVRQTSGGVEARLGDEILWTVPKHVPRKDPTKAFISLAGPLDVPLPKEPETP